jgi:hypothetical protein
MGKYYKSNRADQAQTNVCLSFHKKEKYEASFLSTGLIQNRIDKYNKKIMIATIRDPDLFWIKN